MTKKPVGKNKLYSFGKRGYANKPFSFKKPLAPKTGKKLKLPGFIESWANCHRFILTREVGIKGREQMWVLTGKCLEVYIEPDTKNQCYCITILVSHSIKPKPEQLAQTLFNVKGMNKENFHQLINSVNPYKKATRPFSFTESGYVNKPFSFKKPLAPKTGKKLKLPSFIKSWANVNGFTLCDGIAIKGREQGWVLDNEKIEVVIDPDTKSQCYCITILVSPYITGDEYNELAQTLFNVKGMNKDKFHELVTQIEKTFQVFT